MKGAQVTDREALDALVRAGWMVIMVDTGSGLTLLGHFRLNQVLLVGNEDWDMLRAPSLQDAAETMGHG